MFGYVTANKPELKIREFARYKGYYCGLCHTLLENHGRRGQMTLTYDMTFLVILLSSLYEPKEEEMRKRCLIHPAKKQRVGRQSDPCERQIFSGRYYNLVLRSNPTVFGAEASGTAVRTGAEDPADHRLC